MKELVQALLIDVSGDRRAEVKPKIFAEHRSDLSGLESKRRYQLHLFGYLAGATRKHDPLQDTGSTAVCGQPDFRRFHNVIGRQPFPRQLPGDKMRSDQVCKQLGASA